VIAFIRGEVWKTGPDFVVVDTGDQGIKVLCPAASAVGMRVGDSVLLYTALIVREDSWTIYGFAEEAQCEMFDLVQTVSGIGPRIALGVVAALSPDNFAEFAQQARSRLAGFCWGWTGIPWVDKPRGGSGHGFSCTELS
jgi:Holliday junction resolvasome RuvABC DNA-binding subunit